MKQTKGIYAWIQKKSDSKDSLPKLSTPDSFTKKIIKIIPNEKPHFIIAKENLDNFIQNYESFFKKHGLEFHREELMEMVTLI